MPFDSPEPSAPSDGHRMIWVEVCNQSLLNKHLPHSSQAINSDRCYSKDPRCRKLYTKKVKKQYARRRMFDKFKKYQHKIKRYTNKRMTPTEEETFLTTFPSDFKAYLEKSNYR